MGWGGGNVQSVALALHLQYHAEEVTPCLSALLQAWGAVYYGAPTAIRSAWARPSVRGLLAQTMCSMDWTNKEDVGFLGGYFLPVTPIPTYGQLTRLSNRPPGKSHHKVMAGHHKPSHTQAFKGRIFPMQAVTSRQDASYCGMTACLAWPSWILLQ